MKTENQRIVHIGKMEKLCASVSSTDRPVAAGGSIVSRFPCRRQVCGAEKNITRSVMTRLVPVASLRRGKNITRSVMTTASTTRRSVARFDRDLGLTSPGYDLSPASRAESRNFASTCLPDAERQRGRLIEHFASSAIAANWALGSGRKSLPAKVGFRSAKGDTHARAEPDSAIAFRYGAPRRNASHPGGSRDRHDRAI